MFERFTTGARQSIVLAQDEARKLNHDYIGTEHLLLGVLSEGGAGAGLLGTAGVSLEAAHARVVAAEAPPTHGQIPFTPRARGVLEQALRESLRLGHNYIGTEHLVLGLFADPESTAATILADLGASRSNIEGKVTASGPSQHLDAVVQSGFASSEPERYLGYDECVAALRNWDGREVIAVSWPSPNEIDRPYLGRLSFSVQDADRALLRVSSDAPGGRSMSFDVWREEFGGGRSVADGGLDVLLAGNRWAIFPS